jgi:hypothetical protein
MDTAPPAEPLELDDAVPDAAEDADPAGAAAVPLLPDREALACADVALAGAAVAWARFVEVEVVFFCVQAAVPSRSTAIAAA